MPHFKFSQTKVYYTIVGEGKPLILLHGNSVSSEMFAQVLADYAKFFKVILIDFPGHGKSERVVKFETDFWFYNAKVVYALIQGLGFEKVSVVGTSGGALVAINLGLEHPECIEFIVADSFEGEAPLPSFMETLVADRNRDKQNPLAQEFWKGCHGKDWEQVVDQDTQMLLDFGKAKKSFFHQSIAGLKGHTILTGSRQDEYCDHLDQIYAGLKKRNQELDIYLFDEGGHPAMLSNHTTFLELVKEQINKK